MAKAGTLIARIAQFALGLELRDIPEASVRRMTRILADTLDRAIAARGEELTTVLAAHARAQSSPQATQATLLPLAGRASLPLAALINTAAARMLDANDIYVAHPAGVRGHFSHSISAILATAEVAGSNGADTRAWAILIAAMHLGTHRLLDAITAAAVAGTTGEALDTWLRPDQPVTAMRTLGPALSAQRAIEAVAIAQLGTAVSAPDDALETLFRRLSRDQESMPVDRLGSCWTIEGNLIKRYPAQFFTQAAVQGTLALRSQGLRDLAQFLHDEGFAGAPIAGITGR